VVAASLERAFSRSPITQRCEDASIKALAAEGMRTSELQRSCGVDRVPTILWMDVEDFIDRYPTVFHMAAEGAWPHVRRNGLLSTTALLDRYKVTGDRRRELEACRRGKPARIEHPDTGETAVLRDNGPINERLLRDDLLVGDTTLEEWYRLLNRHVFFWVHESGLSNFLRVYRKSAHDVITVSTRRLVARDYDRIIVTPMNTGSASWRTELRRGRDIFEPHIHEFDLEAWELLTPARRDAIVELAVDYAVESIEDITVRVDRRAHDQVPRPLWEHPELSA